MHTLQLIYACALIVGVITAFGVIIYEQFKRPKKANGKKRLNKYQVKHKGVTYTVPKDVHELILENQRRIIDLRMEVQYLQKQIYQK